MIDRYVGHSPTSQNGQNTPRESIGRGGRTVLLAFGLLATLTLAACGTQDAGIAVQDETPIETPNDTPDDTPEDEPEDTPEDKPEPHMEPDPTGHPTLSLLGDPSFSEAALSEDARLWYQRFWASVENPRQDPDGSSLAHRGDSYVYGRHLGEHLTTYLFAFRATGDLAILDEVDRMTQIMRSKLRKTFVTSSGDQNTPDDPNHADAYEPTDGTAHYLRWNNLYSADHYGTDTNDLDEIMTHSMLAKAVYAFHLNRDAVSPAGVDYNERADFWIDYLENHFEAKWRHRNSTHNTFPFLIKTQSHAMVNFAIYHHYMGLMTGKDAYLDEAQRMTNAIIDNDTPCESSAGPTLLWEHGNQLEREDSKDFLQPTTYVKYEIWARMEIMIEGMTDRIDATHMQKLANSISQYVVDGDPDNTGKPFASSLGGDESRCGVRYKAYRDRRTIYEGRHWAPLVLWDATGELNDTTTWVYEEIETDINNPRRPQIPVANLLDAVWN